MSGPSNKVLLSCVTAEFEAPTAAFPGFRGRLRHYLARADYDARPQEDFPNTDADIVLKTATIIRGCHAVIHLVGGVPGKVADPKAVAEYLAKEPAFLAGHPELRAALGDFHDLTYSQWEAFQALHHGVSLRVYATPAGRAAQAAHLDRLKLARKYAADFKDEPHLLGQLIADLKGVHAAPPAAPADRWFRTSRSPGNDGTGLSYLAVAESVVATVVFVGIVAYTGWYFLLVTAVLMAPLALLRTDESDRRAEVYARRMLARTRLVKEMLDASERGATAGKHYVDNSMTEAWMYAVRVLVVVAVARLIALVVSLCRELWGSVAAMPRNWSRVCVSTDVIRAVELIPGSPEYPVYSPKAARVRESLLRFGLLWNHWRGLAFMTLVCIVINACIMFVYSGFSSLVAWDVVEGVATLMVVSYAPFYLTYVFAFWYRWSLKSTSVVWLPLLYIAADVTAPGWNAERRLSRAVHSRFAASMRWFGLVCSAAAVGWIVFRAVGVSAHPQPVEFAPVIDPDFRGPAVRAVDIWSGVSVGNTALAWLVYWLADTQLERRAHGAGWSDRTVLRWLRTITLTRWCLFAFSWACTLWVAVRIATHAGG